MFLKSYGPLLEEALRRTLSSESRVSKYFHAPGSYSAYLCSFYYLQNKTDTFLIYATAESEEAMMRVRSYVESLRTMYEAKYELKDGVRVYTISDPQYLKQFAIDYNPYTGLTYGPAVNTNLLTFNSAQNNLVKFSLDAGNGDVTAAYLKTVSNAAYYNDLTAQGNRLLISSEGHAHAAIAAIGSYSSNVTDNALLLEGSVTEYACGGSNYSGKIDGNRVIVKGSAPVVVGGITVSGTVTNNTVRIEEGAQVSEVYGYTNSEHSGEITNHGNTVELVGAQHLKSVSNFSTLKLEVTDSGPVSIEGTLDLRGKTLIVSSAALLKASSTVLKAQRIMTDGKTVIQTEGALRGSKVKVNGSAISL